MRIWHLYMGRSVIRIVPGFSTALIMISCRSPRILYGATRQEPHVHTLGTSGSVCKIEKVEKQNHKYFNPKHHKKIGNNGVLISSRFQIANHDKIAAKRHIYFRN